MTSYDWCGIPNGVDSRYTRHLDGLLSGPIPANRPDEEVSDAPQVAGKRGEQGIAWDKIVRAHYENARFF
jgi:hypothetical protein